MISTVTPSRPTEPPCWNAYVPLPSDTVRLLKEVSQDIDETKYVALKAVAESLGPVNGFLVSEEKTQEFVGRFMRQVMHILLDPSECKYIENELKGTVLIEEGPLLPAKKYPLLVRVKGLTITLLDIDDKAARAFLFTIQQIRKKDKKGMTTASLDSVPLPRVMTVPNKSKITRIAAEEQACLDFPPLPKATTLPTKNKSAPPRIVAEAKKPASTSKETIVRTKKKVNFNHPCIHGAACQFLRNGIDHCRYYHSTVEIAQAAAKSVQRIVYIPPHMIGWVLGTNGVTMKEMVRKSGAKMWISNQTKMDSTVHISGSREAVNAGEKMVKDKIAKYDASTAPVEASNAKPSAKVLLCSAEANASDGIVPPARPSVFGQSMLQWSRSREAMNASETMVKDKISKYDASTAPVEASNAKPSAKVLSCSAEVNASDGIVSPARPSVFGQSMLQWSKVAKNGPPRSDPNPHLLASKPVWQQQVELQPLAPCNTTPRQPTNQQVTHQATVAPGPSTVSAPTARVPIGIFSMVPCEKKKDNWGSLPIISNLCVLTSEPDCQQPQTRNMNSSSPFSPLSTSVSLWSQQATHQSFAPDTTSSSAPISRVCTSSPDAESWKIIAPPSLPKPVTPTFTDSSLLAFLKEQKGCLKGSPAAFHRWLVETEDITSLDDLVDAMAQDTYLRDVLQPGDGNIGVKGFKTAVFKKAAVDAATCVLDNGPNSEADKDRGEPPYELICPISHALMTEDPVIAADGHSYERAAIEMWFQKQQAEILVAMRQLSMGSHSQHALTIVQRGVLSPLTHAKMAHLHLIPNHALRTMARDEPLR